MNEGMKKLLMSKLEQGKEMSPEESHAQSSVLKDLRGSMGGLMGGKLNGLKKVTVASDSPSGLKEGLNTAEELVGKTSLPDDLMPEEESTEGHDDHKGEIYEKAKMMSAEELDACIQELQLLKEEKQHEQA